jgi:hypothetical protein
MEYSFGYEILTYDELQKLKTRQLLSLLRKTHSWGCPDYWEREDLVINKIHEYQKLIKSVLATREHIPNKIESKAIRKAKIKKGK